MAEREKTTYGSQGSNGCDLQNPPGLTLTLTVVALPERTKFMGQGFLQCNLNGCYVLVVQIIVLQGVKRSIWVIGDTACRNVERRVKEPENE
jgi:hypothetical protein